MMSTIDLTQGVPWVYCGVDPKCVASCTELDNFLHRLALHMLSISTNSDILSPFSTKRGTSALLTN